MRASRSLSYFLEVPLPDGERIFYISNPAIGLWAYRGRFEY